MCETISEKRKIYFIHLHKCGGSFVSYVLASHNIENIILRGHETINTSQKKSDTVIGLIRNPFEWYVSLWASGCNDGKGLYFEDYHPNKLYLYEDYTNVNNFRAWLKFLMTEYNEPENARRTMNQYDTGLLTYRFFMLYNEGNYELLDSIANDPLVDFFIRNEDIIGGLNSFLDLSLSEHHPRVNTSEHLSVSKYYDEETTKLVIQKDRYIFDKFDYDKFLP